LLHGSRPVRRVGIVLLTGIGDVVHGLPLANDIKRRTPGTEVVWVAEPAPAEVLRHHPAVDHVVVFDKRAGARGVVQLLRELSALRCDISINCMRYAKSIWPVLGLRAPVRLGLARDKTRDGVHWLATHTLPEGPWEHTQDIFLRFREALGVPADDPVEWQVSFSDEEEAAAEHWRRDLLAATPQPEGSRPLIGLVLASANAAKDWPAEAYAALADPLVERFGALPVLIGGPSSREREVADLVMSQARHRVVDALGPSVREMMWRVREVDLLISPDTGPLHLAHALGTPVVGLFGHTNPARVGPWRDSRDLVVDRYFDAGEAWQAALYTPRHGRMEQISVDDVLEAAGRALDAEGRAHEAKGPASS
jgi:heptosyltransferase I